MAEQQQMQVVCPQGCSPGDLIAVTALNGQQLQVQIPAGVGPGVPFLINTPSAVPASSLVATPAPDEGASLLPVTNTAQKPGTKKLVVTAEEPSSPAAKKAAEEKAKADATAADKEKEAAALKEKEAAAAAAVWGDNCCLTRAACKARYQEDLDETETCAGKCCVRKAHYETILIIVSTLVTVLFIVFQFGIRQRMQLTQGMPFPMFLNGTCTCTGADGFSAELCPDVVFTLNISGIDDEYDDPPCDPAVDLGGDEGSDCVFGYWESWRWTNDVVNFTMPLDTVLPPLPPPPPSAGCRADICGDSGDDCCAPGDEARSCKEAGYSVVPGGTSSWGPCVDLFAESAVYQCCRDADAEHESEAEEEPELYPNLAFTPCMQDHNKAVCGDAPCSRQLNCRGNLDRYNLVMLPAEGNARLSLYDNACWTKPGTAIEKQTDRNFQSANTILGLISIAGAFSQCIY